MGVGTWMRGDVVDGTWYAVARGWTCGVWHGIWHMARGMIYGHTAYGWDAGYPVAGNPQLGLVMEPGRLNPLVLPANETNRTTTHFGSAQPHW